MIAALGADAEPPRADYLAVGLRAATGWPGLVPQRGQDVFFSTRGGDSSAAQGGVRAVGP
jgi:hypothetical protein